MKSFYISDAAAHESQEITSLFVLVSVSSRDRKQGGSYLAITLADRGGQLEARMWDGIDEQTRMCEPGSYVKVQGTVSKYQGKWQITVHKMRLAAENEIAPEDFVATTTRDIPAMWVALRAHANTITDLDLKRLVNAFFDDAKIAAEFQRAPAARGLHHAWIGGLLEHVLDLVEVCIAIAPLYSGGNRPEVNRDLLLTGAMLHDIGKTRELSWGSHFAYTTEGSLVGHISIAMGMLREKIAEVSKSKPFPDKLRVLVEHMILSHHGKLEFGSPKLPMTPEAVVLSALDDLEAKLQNMRGEFQRDAAQGRSGREITDWVRSLDRPLLNSAKYLEPEEEK
jgi:3'-5' exoribonuclease